MSGDSEIVMRDVTNAGLVVSDRIGRDVASQIDLEDALEASRYASHPYTAQPREVTNHFIEFCDFRFHCLLNVFLLYGVFEDFRFCVQR